MINIDCALRIESNIAICRVHVCQDNVTAAGDGDSGSGSKDVTGHIASGVRGKA